MSSLKAVLDIGLQFVPVVGKALDAGLDMATTAAQMAAYLYSNEDKPEEAFSWWLSPCGGTELVPDEIKKIFDILSLVTDGVSSFKKPKNLKKGSGKKGDNGNPHDQSTPRSTKPTSNTKSKCSIPKNKEVRQIGTGKNTIRKLSCDKNDKTQTNDEILVSAVFANNPSKLAIKTACPAKAGQACYHYESAIKANPRFATLTCPQEAASTKWRLESGKATASWSNQHKGDGWYSKNKYYEDLRVQTKGCDRDEYPPAYLLNDQDPAHINGGKDINGQMVRLVPSKMNSAGGKLWKGVCFQPLLKGLQMADLRSIVDKDKNKKTVISKGGVTATHATFTVTERPEFQITSWPKVPAPPPNHPTWSDGVADNPCWNEAEQAEDPGFQLFTWDAWYNNNPRPYDYQKPYKKGSNGS
jgi:hypothetical protein